MRRNQPKRSRGLRSSTKTSPRKAHAAPAGKHAEALEQRRLLTITPIAATSSVPNGNPETVVAGTFTDSTPSLANDYTAEIVWGDGTSAAGTVTANSSGIYTVTGTHTYPQVNAGELVTVGVVESDGPANSDTATIFSTLSVSDSNTLAGTLATFSPTENKPFSGEVATFTDTGNPSAVASNFTATINWGDGTSTTGVVPTGNNASYTVSGSHTYPLGADGPETVSVVLSDNAPGTVSATATGTINVQVIPFTVTGVPVTGGEDVALTNVPVATFSDPGTATPAGYTATINFGDGDTSTGSVVGSNGSFTVTGTETYATFGKFTVTTSVVDGPPNFTAAPAISTATISDTNAFAPVSGVFSPFTEGMPGTLTAFFSDANTVTPASDLTSIIKWGDGTSSVGTVSGSAGTFTVTGVHTYVQVAVDAATATITENAPGSASGSISGSVIPADANVFSPDGTTGTTGPSGSTTTLAAVFSDTFQLSPASNFNGAIKWGDGTSSIGTVSGSAGGFYTVSATHVYANVGPFTTTATIATDAPGTATGTLVSVLVVPDGNVLSGSLASISATEATPFSGTVATFTNTGEPTNPASGFAATINWGDGTSSAGTIVGTGVYTVSGAHTYADGLAGPETVSVSIHDTAPGTATATASGSFVLQELASTFLVTAGSSITGKGGSSVSGTIATFTDNGSKDPASDYQTTINWGDGTSSSGTVSGSAGSYTVAGTHTYISQGNYSVTTTVADSGANFTAAPVTSTATIADGNAFTPVSASPTIAPDGSATKFVAVFSDADQYNTNASNFNGAINWGDGTSSTGTVSGSGAFFTVSGTHAYANLGSFTATATISENAPGTATGSLASVLVIPDGDVLSGGSVVAINATEGTPFTGPVATFTNTGYPGNPASNFNATITWGDGTSSAGTVSGTGTYTVSGSHTYADGSAGPETVGVSISDNAPGTVMSSTAGAFVLQENASTFIVTGANLTGKEGSPVSGTVAKFTDAGSPDPAADYQATINWGDGTSSSGAVSGSAGSYTVTGAHTYADYGSYTMSTTVTEGGVGFTASPAISTATVADLNVLAATKTQTPVTIQAGALSTVLNVATFTDTGYPASPASDFTATIKWGDGQTTAGTVSGGSGSNLTVSAIHGYVDHGSYTATVTLADDAPGIAKATATNLITVTQAPIEARGVNITAVEGNAFTNQIVGSFYDLNLSEVGDSTVITWGDGTSSAGTEVSVGGGTYLVEGSHTFTNKGTYRGTITIYDDKIAGKEVPTFTTTVADAPLVVTGLTISAKHGVAFSGTVADMVDGNPLNTSAKEYVGTISWGDGTSSGATFTYVSPGHWLIKGTHTYAKAGKYMLGIGAYDEGSAEFLGSGIANVT